MQITKIQFIEGPTQKLALFYVGHRLYPAVVYDVSKTPNPLARLQRAADRRWNRHVILRSKTCANTKIVTIYAHKKTLDLNVLPTGV